MDWHLLHCLSASPDTNIAFSLSLAACLTPWLYQLHLSSSVLPTQRPHVSMGIDSKPWLDTTSSHSRSLGFTMVAVIANAVLTLVELLSGW